MLSILAPSFLVEILLALNSINFAPESLTYAAQTEVVIERICAKLEAPESLDCAIDVLLALEDTTATATATATATNIKESE